MLLLGGLSAPAPPQVREWRRSPFQIRKVDPGDRVNLPVKFACKPELTLTR